VVRGTACGLRFKKEAARRPTCNGLGRVPVAGLPPRPQPPGANGAGGVNRIRGL